MLNVGGGFLREKYIVFVSSWTKVVLCLAAFWLVFVFVSNFRFFRSFFFFHIIFSSSFLNRFMFLDLFENQSNYEYMSEIRAIIVQIFDK